MSTVNNAGHVIARVTRPDGSTADLDLGDVDSVVNTRHEELVCKATRRDRGPVTRGTYYALRNRAYNDVVDRGWPVW